jgi:hypothetical protein
MGNTTALGNIIVRELPAVVKLDEQYFPPTSINAANTITFNVNNDLETHSYVLPSKYLSGVRVLENDGAGNLSWITKGSFSSPIVITVNTATTDPLVDLVQQGTGDTPVQFSTPSADYMIGIDQSDSNKFKLSKSTALGTGDIFTADGTTFTIQDATLINNDLTVMGVLTSIESNNLVITDVNIKIANGNTADLVDGGFYMQYNDGTTRYSGLFRDASDAGTWKLYDNLVVEPTTTVNTGDASFRLTNLDLGTLHAAISLVLEDPGVGGNVWTIIAPTLTGNRNLTLPTIQAVSNNLALISSTTGILSYNNQALLTTSSVQFNSITDGVATLTGGALSGATTISCTGDITIQDTGSVYTIVKSTTTGVANEGGLKLDRGDQANGFSQVHYQTAATDVWVTGLRSGDADYHTYLQGTGDITTLSGTTMTFTPATFNLTHSGATKIVLSSTSGTVDIESVNFNGGVVTNVTSLTSTTLTDGILSINAGAITGMVSATDGTASWSGSNLSGFGTITCTGALRSNTSLILEDPGGGTFTWTIAAPTLAGSRNLTLPTIQAGSNNLPLISSTTGVLSYNDQPLLTTSNVQFNKASLVSANDTELTFVDSDYATSLFYMNLIDGNKMRYRFTGNRDTDIGIEYELLLPSYPARNILINYWANSASTGQKSMRFFRGDGTVNVDARISLNNTSDSATYDTFFCINDGGAGASNFGIGTQTPATKLEVTGTGITTTSLTDGVAILTGGALSGITTIASTGISSGFYKAYHSYHDSTIPSGGNAFVRVLIYSPIAFDDGCTFAIGMINGVTGSRVNCYGILTRSTDGYMNVHLIGEQRGSGIDGFACSDQGTDFFIELTTTASTYNEYQVWILNRFCGNGGTNNNYWQIDTANTSYTLATLKATFGYNYIPIVPDDTWDISLNNRDISHRSFGGKEEVFLRKKLTESSGAGILDFSLFVETNALDSTTRFGYGADTNKTLFDYYQNVTQFHRLACSTDDSFLCGTGTNNLAIGKTSAATQLDVAGTVTATTFTDGSASLSSGALSGVTTIGCTGDVTVQDTGSVYTSISSTTTGAPNEGGLLLSRGDQANGFAQIHYRTAGGNVWDTGLRSGDANYHMYLQGTGDVATLSGTTMTFTPATFNLTHSGATKIAISSTSGTVDIEAVNFAGGVVTGVTSLTGTTLTDGTASMSGGKVVATSSLNTNPARSFCYSSGGTQALVAASGYTKLTIAWTDVKSQDFTINSAVNGEIKYVGTTAAYFKVNLALSCSTGDAAGKTYYIGYRIYDDSGASETNYEGQTEILRYLTGVNDVGALSCNIMIELDTNDIVRIYHKVSVNATVTWDHATMCITPV